jgi:primase-polymerase (primpol)-like protein
LWLGGDTEEEISESIAVSDGPALLVTQSDAFRTKAAQLEQILDDLVTDRGYTRKAIRSKHPLRSNDGCMHIYIHIYV